MAGKISFECPGCSAKLSVGDRSKLGKKIKCPKCQEVFLPEVPDEEELEDFDDEVDEEPKKSSKPLKRGAVSAKKTVSKGKSTGGGSNGALIGGGIAALILVGGIGLFASGAFSGKAPPFNPESTTTQPAPVAAVPPSMPNPAAAHSQMPVSTITRPQVAPTSATAPMTPAEKALGLRWFPANIDLIVHAKISDIWKAPLLRGPLSDPSVTKGIEELEKLGYLPPAEIESITFGMGKFTEAFSIGLAAAGNVGSNRPQFGAPPPEAINPRTQQFVIVLKSKSPLDLKRMFDAATAAQAKDGTTGATMKEKNGKPYFVTPDSPTAPLGGGWQPDANTLVFGTIDELLETIDKGETQTPRKAFATIDHSPHVVIAFAVPDVPLEENDTSSAMMKQFRDSVKPYAVRLASLGISIRGGFDLVLSGSSETDEGAKLLKSSVESNVSQSKSLFELYKATTPPFLAELGDMLLSNLKIEESNRVVTISTNVPDSAQSQLEQLPSMLMMMAMTSRLPGMAGPGASSAFGLGGDAGPMGTGGFGGMKQPGETDSVPSVKVEGLPEGLTITAKTAWSPFPMIATDGTSSITMDVLIDVTGDGLETICASTGVSPKTMKLDGGTKLKVSKQPGLGGIDPQKTFKCYDSSDSFQMAHPPNTLRVRLSADAPSPAAKKIDFLEGSFKILTSGDGKEFTIEDAPKRAKRPLTSSEFKTAELKLRRSLSGTFPETLSLWCGKDYFLGQVKGSPGDVLSITEVDKEQTIQRIYSTEDDGSLPDDLQITFKLFSNVKEQEVTFRFENVPLPSVETKPILQAPAGQ